MHECRRVMSQLLMAGPSDGVLRPPHSRISSTALVAGLPGATGEVFKILPAISEETAPGFWDALRAENDQLWTRRPMYRKYIDADGKTVEREGCWQELRDQQEAMWQRRNAKFMKRYKLGTDGPTFGRGGCWQKLMDGQEAMWQARNKEFLARPISRATR